MTNTIDIVTTTTVNVELPYPESVDCTGHAYAPIIWTEKWTDYSARTRSIWGNPDKDICVKQHDAVQHFYYHTPDAFVGSERWFHKTAEDANAKDARHSVRWALEIPLERHSDRTAANVTIDIYGYPGGDSGPYAKIVGFSTYGEINPYALTFVDTTTRTFIDCYAIHQIRNLLES